MCSSLHVLPNFGQTIFIQQKNPLGGRQNPFQFSFDSKSLHTPYIFTQNNSHTLRITSSIPMNVPYPFNAHEKCFVKRYGYLQKNLKQRIFGYLRFKNIHAIQYTHNTLSLLDDEAEINETIHTEISVNSFLKGFFLPLVFFHLHEFYRLPYIIVCLFIMLLFQCEYFIALCPLCRTNRMCKT